MGMTMSSSSFRRGVGDTVAPAIGEVEREKREIWEERERRGALCDEGVWKRGGEGFEFIGRIPDSEAVGGLWSHVSNGSPSGEEIFLVCIPSPTLPLFIFFK